MASVIVAGVPCLKQGFSRFAAIFFIVGDDISESAVEIALDVASQWITLMARSLPFWRIPMSSVGTPNDATSTMPLELLPITPSDRATADR